MAKQRNTFKLGLAMLLFGALFVGTLVFIAGGLPSDTHPVQVRFPATDLAARLKEGGEIVCGGQMVGSIRSIQFRSIPKDTGGEELYVYINGHVSREVGLRQDCHIEPGEPLLGEVGKLVIKDRGVGKPVDPRQVIDGVKAMSLNAAIEMLSREFDIKNKDGLLTMIKGQLDSADAKSLLGKLHRSLDDMNQMTRNISVQLDPHERNVLIAKLHSVMDNINAMTALMRQQVDPANHEMVMAKVHTALDSLNKGLFTATAMLEENRPVIRDTLGDVRDTAKILEEKIATRIAQELDVNQAASLLAKVHTGISRFNKSLQDLNDITGTGRDLVVAKQAEISKVVTNFLETSEHLKAAAKEIYRSPWRLLYKPTEQESKELNVYDAARAFAEAATRLDNAMVRMQGIVDARGGTVKPDDAELIAVRDSLQQTFQQFTAAEQALWKQLGIH